MAEAALIYMDFAVGGGIYAPAQLKGGVNGHSRGNSYEDIAQAKG